MANKDARYKRLMPLIKEVGLTRLKNSTVMVLGVGGVGSFAIEALARSGVGRLIIVDYDVVDASNINRQLIALTSTIGKPKVDIMKARILDINPECEVIAHKMFYDAITKETLYKHDIDFVFDAIDTLTFKLDIIKTCLAKHIPFITSCGQGNRLDPSHVTIKDLRETNYDPVARRMRIHFRRAKIYDPIPCVFSEEIPFKEKAQPQPYSTVFVPGAAGLQAASYITRHLIKG